MSTKQTILPIILSALLINPATVHAEEAMKQLPIAKGNEMQNIKENAQKPSELSEEKLSKILEDVKKRIVILDQGANFTYTVGLDYGQNYYNLRWETDQYAQEIRYGDDANIYSYNYYEKQDSYQEQPLKKLPKFSKTEAETLGKDFLKQCLPGEFKNYDLTNNELSGNFYYLDFNYKRNNIPVQEVTCRVTVNAMTGKVTGLYTNYNPMAKFETSRGIITVKNAEETYKNKIGLKKIYTYDYNSEKHQFENIKIAYVPNLDTRYAINAKTGKVEKIAYSIYRNGFGGMGEGELKSADSLTPQERKEIQSKSGLKTMEQAKAEAEKAGLVEKTATLTGSNLYERESQTARYVWSLNYVKDDEQYGIELDAKTLELVSFYGPANYDVQHKITEGILAKAQAKANSYIAKHSSKSQDKLILQSVDLNDLVGTKSSVISLNYTRFENDAYVMEDGINLLYDITDDKIVTYNLNWTNIQLPKYERYASTEQIFEKIFGENKIGLSYKLVFNSNRQNYDAKLYYEPQNPDLPLIFAADTGERIQSESKITKISYPDINDSKYPNEINALANLGIGFADEKLQPKKATTQREFLDLLLQTKGYGYIIPLRSQKTDPKNYMDAGLLLEGEKVTDQALTRQEAAKYLIRAAGYEKVAKHTEIFTSQLPDMKDIDANLRGYVIIASALKYADTGQNENFNPKQNASRETALKMIYNYLDLQ